MPPAKRKAPLRRQVLDLKGEDSSRSTWQTKYQSLQSEDGIRQNGDQVVETSDNTPFPADIPQTNPLSGLVGNYNSDSDNEESEEAQKNSLDAKVQDFLKEIQSLSSGSDGTTVALNSSSQTQSEKPQPSPIVKWQQCYDHNSGYPYYWNTETNEVTWEMPNGFEVLAANVTKISETGQDLQHQLPETSLSKEKKEVKKKPVCRYPWDNESDSEDEKIEMITSFGPQSGEEDSEEEQVTTKSKIQNCKETTKGLVVGPQLPLDSSVQNKKRTSESDDTEVESINDSSYETSCLLTYQVQDTGPPGDDGFIVNNETNSVSETRSKIDISVGICSEAADNSSKKESQSTDIIKSNAPSYSNSESHLPVENSEKIISEHSNRVRPEKSDLSNVVMSKKCQENVLEGPSFDLADNVIAEIEKELPPDYNAMNPKIEEKLMEAPASDVTLDNSNKIANNTKASSMSGIALLANYEDDSESEEGNLNEKRKERDKRFNDKSMEKVTKPLFPCMEADIQLQLKEPFLEKKTVESETSNIYDSEVNLLDSSVMHKAFKRKKRIEFATTGFGSSASLEPKTASTDNSRIFTSTQYNMDPTSNEHRGFGFAPATSAESNKSKYNTGWIQFVKMETMNLNQDFQSKQKTELRTEGKQQSSEEDVRPEEIEDDVLLLKEKVTFLTEGKEEISPIQHIAIQLETLLIAWQQGALSNAYFCRWVKEKCSALVRHEKSAAPTGWTCLWDRKSKRYFYRNVATKVIQWDYPTPENEAMASSTSNPKQTKEGDPEGGGEEMELCLTPPHPSAAEEDKVNNDSISAPASAVSNTSRSEGVPVASSVTSNSTLTQSGRVKSKNKKDLSTVSEDEADSKSTPTDSVTASTECEKQEDAPPLPPMPPPEEPPPPPPGSPPPLPLDHDQPLPPGVDEPEYGMFRRQSPRQSLVKSQVDTSSYSTDVIMTYGYAMQVQSSTPSVTAISLQPVDYHGFVHDHLNTNHYVVPSVPASHVIHCPAKKSKFSLASELDSFYSDIAMLDNDSTADKTLADVPIVQEPSPSAAVQSTQPIQRPVPSSCVSTLVTTIKHTENSSSNSVPIKRKKKAKMTPGLSMKKKGVSSLVAKWQQVQQEVRRDLNSGDDEDEDSSTHNK